MLAGVTAIRRPTLWEAIYAFYMAVACAISYILTTELLGRFVDQANTLLGGMWAAIATVFVFRETREESVSAGISRLIATCVSFVPCFNYIAWSFGRRGRHRSGDRAQHHCDDGAAAA
jgi:hypothetical protein